MVGCPQIKWFSVLYVAPFVLAFVLWITERIFCTSVKPFQVSGSPSGETQREIGRERSRERERGREREVEREREEKGGGIERGCVLVCVCA